MITIREKAQGKRKYYERAVSVGDNEIVQLVEYRMTTVEKDSRVFFVLYDDEMNSISPFFRFLLL